MSLRPHIRLLLADTAYVGPLRNKLMEFRYDFKIMVRQGKLSFEALCTPPVPGAFIVEPSFSGNEATTARLVTFLRETFPGVPIVAFDDRRPWSGEKRSRSALQEAGVDYSVFPYEDPAKPKSSISMAKEAVEWLEGRFFPKPQARPA